MLANHQHFQSDLFIESKYLYYTETQINQLLLTEGLSNFKFPTIPKNFDFKKAYNDINNKAYNYLNKFKITKSDINSLVSQIKSDYTSNKDPSKAAKNIINTSSKFVKSRVMDESSGELNTIGEKVIWAIILTVILIMINTFAMMLFPPPLGFIIVAVFVAPIIEEFAKRMAIKENMPWLYVSIFSGLEYVMWIVQLIMLGVHPIQAILIRIMPVIMHFFTTLIQTKWHDKSKRKNDPYYSKVGFFLAVLFHMLYNFLNIAPILQAL